MSSKTAIRGACVLTLGSKTPNFPEADILIENGVVSEVGPRVAAKDADVIDGRETIVMPGFVDTHRHVWRSLFRNDGEASSDITRPDLQPDDVYAATLVGLLGATEAGITTVVDWADIPLEDEHIDAALQAHDDAGLRTVLVLAAPTGGRTAADVHDTVDRRLSGRADSRTTVAFGSVGLSGDNVDQLGNDWAAARGLGMRIHAHAGLRSADAGVVSAMGQRHLLGSDVTLVHCSHLDDADLDAIAASSASVSLAPSSEMAAGLGAPPLQKLLDRNIEPGLAVGDERVAPGDMFAQMRITNSVQHAAYFDLKLAGKAGLPNLLTTRDVIRYATVVGARTAGLGNVTGSLEVGRQADLIVLRTDRPNIFPINDPIGAVVWGVDTSNIEWVFAGGQVLVRNGQLVTDVNRVRSLAAQAQSRVVATNSRLAESAAGDE